MKARWQTKTLGDVVDFQRGLTYSKNDEVDLSDNVVLRATNIDLASHLLDFTELKFISDKVAVPKSKKVKKDSLLICTASGSKSHLGKIAYIDDHYDYAFGGFMGMLTPNSELVPKYLFYLLTSGAYKDFIGALADGMNINNLKFDELKQFQVPIPPLPEQQRLVGILDEAFDGIATAKANAEKNLQNARALFDSYLEAVFSQRGEGWVEESVSEIATHSLGKMLDKAKNKGDAQPYLRNLNVRWFGFDLSDVSEMRFLPEEAKRYTAVRGDVLVCEGGYPGRAAIWAEDDPIYFQKALHRVRFREPEYNKWFVYFLYSQDKNGELRRYFTGTGIQHFTGEALGRLRLPVAPLSETRRLVSKIEELEAETQRLEALYRQKLARLEELKKALLHQAFAGEL